jgi:hypothetical protein
MANAALPEPTANKGTPNTQSDSRAVARYPAPRSTRLRSVLVALAVGAIVGGILGAAVTTSQSDKPTASAEMQITPVALPAGVLAIDLNKTTTSADDDAYIASQMAYLTGGEFKQAVSDQLKIDPTPDLAVSQNGRTALVTLVATGGTADESERAVKTAIEVYKAHIQAVADTSMSAMHDIVDEALRQVQNRSGNRGARVDRLEDIRMNGDLRAEQPGFVITKQPSIDEDESGVSWTLAAAVGALLGALIAVTALVAARSIAGRVEDTSDPADLADRILHPKIDVRYPWLSPSKTAEAASLGRLLSNQLPVRGTAAGRVLVITGVSGASGAQLVAKLLFAATSEEGAVLVSDAEELRAALAKDPTGDVIVDAGSIAKSTVFAQSIPQATDIVAVARIGVDRAAEARVLMSAASASNATFSAVLTTGSWSDRFRSVPTAPLDEDSFADDVARPAERAKHASTPDA